MSRNRVLVAAAIAASLVSLSAANAQSGSGPTPLIKGIVSENHRSTLLGSVRPEATPANDRGAVSDRLVFEHMLLQLHRSPEQEQALANFVDALETKGSPNYHQWLTPEQ